MRRSWLAQARRSVAYARHILRREPKGRFTADIVRWAIEDAHLYRSYARAAGGPR